MPHVERTSAGLRIHHACPAAIGALTTVAGDDGRWSVLSSGGNAVRWWDLESGPDGGVAFHRQETQGTVRSLALARMSEGADIVVGDSGLGGLWRWDLSSGSAIGTPIAERALPTFMQGTAAAMAVVSADDGPLIVTGGRDGRLRRWDIRSGAAIGEPWMAHERGVHSITGAELPDGSPLIVSGGADGLVRCWDPATGAAYGSVIEKCGPAIAIMPTRLPDGRTVVCVASGRGNVHRRDIVTGEPIGPRITTGWEPGQHVQLRRGRFAAMDRFVATCVDSRTVQVWDLVTGEPVGAPISGAEPIVAAIAMARRPDGTPVVVVGDSDGSVRRFDVRTGEMIGAPVHPHGAQSARVDVVSVPDGRLVLAVDGDSGVRCFDARTGASVGDARQPWRIGPYGLASADLSDGRALLVAASDDGIRRLDLLTGTPYEPSPDETPTTIWDVVTMRLPDGRVLVAGAGHDWQVYRWDAATGAAIGRPLEGHPISVKAITGAVQSDGRPMIISGCESGQVRRWDAVTGVAIGSPLPGDVGHLTVLTVVQIGGRQIIVGVDLDGGMHQWDALTGAIVHPTIKVAEYVFLATTNIDTNDILLWVPGEDYLVERWRLDTGAQIELNVPVTARAIYRDGDQPMMVLSEPDGSITIAPLPGLSSGS
jgi:WD40 repeat protein